MKVLITYTYCHMSFSKRILLLFESLVSNRLNKLNVHILTIVQENMNFKIYVYLITIHCKLTLFYY